MVADWSAIASDLEAMLAEAGYELVDLQVQTGKGARVVLLVDRLGEPGTITLDECATLSGRVGRYLDAADPFDRAYRLLVSSPGVDRPLRTLEHFQRFAGELVQVQYRRSGRRVTIRGRLLGVEGATIAVEVDGEREEVALPEVVKANVVYVWDDEA